MRIALLLIFLHGCTAFVEYEHLSNPGVSGDGYDLICVGGVGEIVTVEVSIAPCKNVNGGEFIKVNARKVFD